MNRLSLLTLATWLLLPLALPAQDATQDSKAILARWDQMEQLINGTRRSLANLQIAYNGAEEPTRRNAIAEQFETLRADTVAKSKDFVADVAKYIEKNPKDQAVRLKRLQDQVFDQLAPKVRAEDAEMLFALTENGEFLHQAAEFRKKGYDYAAAAKLWEQAAELASTHAIWEALGECYMNMNDFARSKAAWERAHDLASSDQTRRAAEQNATIATTYLEDWPREQAMRAEDEKNQDNPLLEIDTSRGTMLVELFEDEAPNTVASFVELAEKGFFDRQLFHRCLAYFMIQGGDPQGTGAGGPGYNIKDEHSLPNARLHYRGSLSTANIGQPNTNGSQFFVTSVVTHHLNGRHTVFGRVLKGLEVAEVLPLDPTNKAEEFMMNSVKVIRKRDHPYVAEKITTPN